MHDSLNLSNLTEPREITYYRLALCISIIGWLICVVTISPILIIGILALLAWLGNGLLVAQIKADAVKADADQLPELANTLARVCEKLGLREIPELYILQSGGMLNAFATRHSGRHFVVVYSEMLETYGPDSAEMEFLLGHELGHIKRSHLRKRFLLWPGLLFPLLGNAYSRACESSCDRHGAFASSDIEGSINAMMVIAGGRPADVAMNPSAFARQYTDHRGFFVSWYELISGYPTLSQRVAALVAIREGRSLSRADRNLLAYPFALFSLGGAASGGANMMITIAMIGMLSAIAIPSFVKARDNGQRAACLNTMEMINEAKESCASKFSYQQGNAISEADIEPFLGCDFATLNCRKGGDYTINPVGDAPECSVHGTLNEQYRSR